MKQTSRYHILLLVVALLIGAIFGAPVSEAQFIDRIVRPCSAGIVTLASVIVNPANSGNINVTPCTGGSLTVNGVIVVPGGVTCTGCTVGILPYFSAANALANSPITRLNVSTVRIPTVQLGTAGTTTGSLILNQSTSLFGTTIQAGNALAARTYIWPTDFGAANSVLTDVAGNGTLSWTAPGACATCVTSAAALTLNQLIIGQGGQAAATLGSLGTTTTVLHGNAAGAPTFSAVVLTADVGGILPALNGGTGVANTNTITLGGNISTAGAFTLSGAFASTFTFTGATNVTFPTSGTLSTTTGTVTSIATTSPITGGAITTTGTIACATCVTSAAALTSTALMTGAGSQGSQTPSATSTLDASGNVSFAGITTSVGRFRGPDGTAALPAYSFTNQTDMGMTNATSGILGFYVGGVRQMDLRANGSLFIPLDAANINLGSAADTKIARTNPGVISIGTGGGASLGTLKAIAYTTDTNCADSAGAAACGSATSGAFVIDAATTSTVVSTTSVTANSQIQLQEDSSLNTRLGITCNTQSSLVLGAPRVTARTAGTNFTVTIELGPTTNPMCINYTIIN